MSNASSPKFEPFCHSDPCRDLDSEPRTIPTRWSPSSVLEGAERQTERFQPARVYGRNVVQSTGKVNRARPARKAQVKSRCSQELSEAVQATGPLFDPFPSPCTFPADWNLMEME